MLKKSFFKENIYKLLPARIAVSIQFKRAFKKKLDMNNLQTLNEKLQFIKLYDNNPLYTICADKIEVKKYIEEKIDSSIIIPTISTWDKFDDIDFSLLPQKFVLKSNHDWDGVYVCRDKKKIDKYRIKKKFDKHIKTNFYYKNKEWAYKNIKPKIFAEELLEDKKNEDIIDYKFFSFNGYVDSVMICVGRFEGTPRFYFFNKKWDLLPFNQDSIDAINTNLEIEKPVKMDEMFDVASKLSEGLPFVRVDLYNVNECIFFGEMTFYPAAGYDNKLLRSTDLYYGNLLDLNLVKKIDDFL